MSAVCAAATVVFDNMADAAKWLADHPEVVVGTVVVVGAVTFVVVTGGAGAPVLVPAAAALLVVAPTAMEP